MRIPRLIIVAWLIAAGLAGTAAAQQVYRCKQADGSIEFSDLPCESDIGQADVVDASHHQGDAPPPDPEASSSRLPPQFRDDDDASGPRAPALPDAPSPGGDLSRGERLSLEQERKRVLSDLKRRHISAERRRELIDDLRRADSELGIGPGRIDEMPYHDQDVYEDNRVYQGVPEHGIRRPDGDG